MGKVEVWGAQYALRIWLKPEVMARYSLMPSDISAALQEQNSEYSIGSLGQNSNNAFQFSLRYGGRKTEVSEFENIIIATTPDGGELHLKDVADIELGQTDYDYINSINGHPGVMGAVHQTSGSNATKINIQIDELIAETSRKMPADIKIVTFDNSNDFLFESIHEVIETLIIAVLLVLARSGICLRRVGHFGQQRSVGFCAVASVE